MRSVILICLLSASFHAKAEQDCDALVKPLYEPLKKCVEKNQECAKEIAGRIVDIAAECGKENGGERARLQQQAIIDQLKGS